MKALVLAAGKSTRIAPISKGLPKPLIEIGGRSVIEHNLLWLKSFGIKDIWVNLNFRSEEIKNHLGDGSNLGLDIRYSFEKEILGTAGAVKKLQDKFKNSFLVVYGDNIFNFDLNSLIEDHNRSKGLVTVALFSIKEHLNSGIAGGRVKVEKGNIVEFIEGHSNFDLVNAGCYVCEPQLCQNIPDGGFYDFAKDLFPDLLQKGILIRAHIIDGYCLGLDDPHSYKKVQKLINK